MTEHNEPLDEAIDLMPVDDWEEDLDEDDALYLKYAFDGAAAIEELAVALEVLAADLRAKGAEGWTLAEPVNGGWAHLQRPEQPLR